MTTKIIKKLIKIFLLVFYFIYYYSIQCYPIISFITGDETKKKFLDTIDSFLQNIKIEKLKKIIPIAALGFSSLSIEEKDACIYTLSIIKKLNTAKYNEELNKRINVCIEFFLFNLSHDDKNFILKKLNSQQWQEEYKIKTETNNYTELNLINLLIKPFQSLSDEQNQAAKQMIEYLFLSLPFEDFEKYFKTSQFTLEQILKMLKLDKDECFLQSLREHIEKNQDKNNFDLIFYNSK